MPLLNFDALDTTPLQREPFDYLVVPDFLTPGALAAANRDYPEITTPGNKDLEALHYGPGFRDLIDELTGPEFARHIAGKFGVNLDETVTTVTVQIVTLLVGDQEFDSPKTLAAFALGLVLFIVTLILNVIALQVVRKYREQYE